MYAGGWMPLVLPPGSVLDERGVTSSAPAATTSPVDGDAMTALDVPLIPALSHDHDRSPLVDDELVARRSRHRRAVRQIPAWIVNSIAADANLSTVAALRDHPDRVLMEIHLRDVADRLLGQMRLTLDDLATATLAAAAQQFYACAGDADLELLQLERERVEREPTVDRYVSCEHDFRSLEDVDHESLSALIASVAWADELAGDYRDPRIDV